MDRYLRPHGPAKSAILISVEDEGIGIDASELTQIFELFYRSPRVIGAKIRGTEPGLSIAKRSAEVFGRELTVATEMGVGSVFTVPLPVAKDVEQKASRAESAVGEHEHERKHSAHRR